MKAVKIAGLVSLLVAGSAMAVPTATWTVSSADAGAIVTPGSSVAWDASVAVTTDCKGLANYAITLLLQKEGAAVPYTFAPAAKNAALMATAGYTGPSSTGTFSTPGKLAGLSAGTGTPWAGPPWVWGVGLDARKNAFGIAPTGKFVLNSGAIDTTGLAEGTYTVKLEVNSSFVLKTYKGTTTTLLNYDVAQTALPTESATKVGSTFTFVVPEPATMILLAGAGLLIRRRQA